MVIARDTPLPRSRRAAAPTAAAVEAPNPLRTYERLQPLRALQLPIAFAVGLAAFALLPAAKENPRLAASFLGWAALLAVWVAVLFFASRSSGRVFALEIVLRKQHYLQALAQASVF